MTHYTTFLCFVLVAAMNCVSTESQSWMDYFANERCKPYHKIEQRQVIMMNIYGCVVQFQNLKVGEYHKYLCEGITNDYCANMVVKYFSYCLTDEEKYLPNMFRSSFNESKERLCEKGSHYIEDTYKKLSQLDCIKNKTFENSAGKCVTGLFEVTDTVPLVLTKSNVCSKIPVLETCIVEEIKSNCDSELLIDVFNILFTPFLNQCNIA